MPCGRPVAHDPDRLHPCIRCEILLPGRRQFGLRHGRVLRSVGGQDVLIQVLRRRRILLRLSGWKPRGGRLRLALLDPSAGPSSFTLHDLCPSISHGTSCLFRRCRPPPRRVRTSHRRPRPPGRRRPCPCPLLTSHPKTGPRRPKRAVRCMRRAAPR